MERVTCEDFGGQEEKEERIAIQSPKLESIQRSVVLHSCGYLAPRHCSAQLGQRPQADPVSQEFECEIYKDAQQQRWKGSSLSCVWLFATPWTAPCQPLLSMEFSKNTGVGCYSFHYGIFLTQGSNPGLPHCRQILYHLSHQGHKWRGTREKVNRMLEWRPVPCSVDPGEVV